MKIIRVKKDSDPQRKENRSGDTYFRQTVHFIELDNEGDVYSMNPHIINVEKPYPVGDYVIDTQCLVKSGYDIKVGFMTLLHPASKPSTATKAA